MRDRYILFSLILIETVQRTHQKEKYNSKYKKIKHICSVCTLLNDYTKHATVEVVDWQTY